MQAGGDDVTAILCRTSEQQTPLMLSAQAMDFPLVKLLIKRGARVDVTDVAGQSVLHWSVRSQGPWSDERKAACKMIIDLLVDSTLSVLSLHIMFIHIPMILIMTYVATEFTYVNCAHCLLRCTFAGNKFANKLSRLQVDVRDYEGRTPMHVACSFGNLVGAQALHQRHASVDVLDSNNHTPLWDALDCSKGRQHRRHLVEYLLDRAGLVQRLRSQSSALVAHALTVGTTETAALVLQQLRAETTPVVVPHAAWMAAAERVAVDDPLLEHLPVGRGASVRALGQVWKGRRAAQENGGDPAGFCAVGVDVKDAHLLLPDTPATRLLRRVCKGVHVSCWTSVECALYGLHALPAHNMGHCCVQMALWM